jgi:hypothetical protein
MEEKQQVEEKLKRLEDESSDTSSMIAESWNSGHEELLAAIADRCQCLAWLHTRCQQRYDSLNFWLTIPSIVIGTLSGSATMGLSALFEEDMQKPAQVLIGLMTLSCGVLTSINNFMKSSQNAESHRAAGLAYAKVHRIIQNELALRRDQRLHAHDFMKVIRAEQDRLQGTSPLILPQAIVEFKIKFGDRADLEKPEITGDLDHVKINRTGRYSDTPILIARVESNESCLATSVPLLQS